MHRFLIVALLIGALMASSTPAVANPLVNNAANIAGPLLPARSIVGVGDIGPECATLIVVGRCYPDSQNGP